MVVKFADTQKEKDQKRIHQATTNLWGGGIGINNLPPQYLTVNILRLKLYTIIIIIIKLKHNFNLLGHTIEW